MASERCGHTHVASIHVRSSILVPQQHRYAFACGQAEQEVEQKSGSGSFAAALAEKEKGDDSKDGKNKKGQSKGVASSKAPSFHRG